MVSQLESSVRPSGAPKRLARGTVLAGAILVGGMATFAAAALSPAEGERVFFIAMGVALVVTGGWFALSRHLVIRGLGGLMPRAAIGAAPDMCCETDAGGLLRQQSRGMKAWAAGQNDTAFSELLDKFIDGAPALAYRLSRAAEQTGIATGTAALKSGGSLWISAQPTRQGRIFWRLKIRASEGDTGEIHDQAPTQAASVQSGELTREISHDDGFLENLPVALMRLSVDGVLSYANAAARKLVGEGLVGGVRLETLLEGLGRSFLDSVRETARVGQGKPEIARVHVDGREKYLQVSLTRVASGDKASLLAVLSDATELKTLEAQFVQSQKMQAVGQLAGGVAHDFNNLLTAINGHCDLLLLRHVSGDQDHGDLIQIRQNAHRAAGLVRQLLAFSRKQTLRPKILNLSDTLSEVTHLLNRLLGEKVMLSIEHGTELRMVRVDERQFEQVIMNLVVNARDAMPKGGTVRIVTRNLRLEQPLERDRASVPVDEYVVVEVTDTGSGITEENIGKIFEPFFTTKRVGEGTGLGLSTVYGIIKQTGGFIFVDSEPDEGTTFTIYLRAHDAEGSIEEKPQPASAAPDTDLTGEGVVLLVEDEAPVRSFSARALRMRGYTVLEASSGEEALEILTDKALEVDVLVSDVIMPGKDGPTWVREALRERPDARVIFISGYTEDAFDKDNADITNSIFLPKPFNISELTQRVKAQIEKRKCSCPAVKGCNGQ